MAGDTFEAAEVREIVREELRRFFEHYIAPPQMMAAVYPNEEQRRKITAKWASHATDPEPAAPPAGAWVRHRGVGSDGESWATEWHSSAGRIEQQPGQRIWTSYTAPAVCGHAFIVRGPAAEADWRDQQRRDGSKFTIEVQVWRRKDKPTGEFCDKCIAALSEQAVAA